MQSKALELNRSSLDYIEMLYEQYLDNPDSVSPQWRQFFQEYEKDTPPLHSNGHANHNGASPVSRADRFEMGNIGTEAITPLGTSGQDAAALQHRVDKMVRNYRVRGHIVARVDPLGRDRGNPPELSPSYFGISEEMMDAPIFSETGKEDQVLTVRKIYQRMRNTYCRYIGAQFMHIDDLSVREWLQSRMEKTENRLSLSREEQLRILKELTDAVVFEEFIQKKYVGAKSFSLEGGETLIPLLSYAIERAGHHGVEEVLIGMAHRGRLNVLCNIMGKHPRQIFKEFEDDHPEDNLGRGDVKYHLGYHNNWLTAEDKSINLALAFNPSHLEYVNTVAQGRMRAGRDRNFDPLGDRGMVMLIHGDAAFAGEGIVQETLNMSNLGGYSTGGTLHIVVNNQIGFTTSPHDGRSTAYCTDVAKMLQSPIFHVNGEDPEAVCQVVQLAMEFRMTFHRDVIIDMYCYRLRGHNEGDEPTFTQPTLYRDIRKRTSVRRHYLEHLLELGGVTREEADQLVENRRQVLEAELSQARNNDYLEETEGGFANASEDEWTDRKHDRQRPQNQLREIWQHYHGGNYSEADNVETAISQEQLSHLLERLITLPEGFTPHPKIKRMLKQREEMSRLERPLDWSAGEALAYASLAVEGHRVRMSGQDVQRGTFSHRHAVLHDPNTDEVHETLRHLSPDQAPVDLYNSPLSESGVLGFEYGYSVGAPDALVIWEAQFGDFSNVAQVIIDQFIASAEYKWKRLTGIVLLLPHGLEGTGPEHASARLERFLLMASGDNIQVCVPSTPAQLFHLMRRQVLRKLRKPLVIMSPKSMLRHPQNVSPASEFIEGSFKPILPDAEGRKKGIKRIILCCGKIYYDLIAERERLDANHIAILRVEQLYPLADETIAEALSIYPKAAEVVWVQEESMNMGAWPSFKMRFCHEIAGRKFRGIGRTPSPSPATGSASSHRMEQQMVLDEAMGEA